MILVFFLAVLCPQHLLWAGSPGGAGLAGCLSQGAGCLPDPAARSGVCQGWVTSG